MKKKCKNCGEWFKPNRFNKHHQQYCTASDCKRVSRKVSNKKYRAKHKDSPEFKNKEKERVYRWRQANPKYSRKNRKKLKEKNALRDIATAEKESDIAVLRDIAYRQSVIFEGFLSLTYNALQDNIGAIKEELYIRGSELSKGSFNFKNEPKEYGNGEKINSS